MNNQKTEEKPKATKIRKLVDARIVVTPGYHPYYVQTPEDTVKYYKDWIREFHEFLRDHRSQDENIMDVEEVYEDQCSACEGAYEPFRASSDDEDEGYGYAKGHKYCAACGEETE